MLFLPGSSDDSLTSLVGILHRMKSDPEFLASLYDGLGSSIVTIAVSQGVYFFLYVNCSRRIVLWVGMRMHINEIDQKQLCLVYLQI